MRAIPTNFSWRSLPQKEHTHGASVRDMAEVSDPKRTVVVFTLALDPNAVTFEALLNERRIIHLQDGCPRRRNVG